MSDDNEIDLDVVMDELGSCGRFQVEVFLYLTFPVMIKAIYNTQYVFAAGHTDYRCMVPQCESSPPVYQAGPWAAFALPAENFECYRKVAIGSSCDPSSFSNEIEPCTSWVYANHYSIVYDFELPCQEWKRTMVGTIHSFAYFTALPALSYFSDTWGRGRVFIFTAIVPAFFGLGRAFVNNYYLYLLMEYLESLTGSGTYSTAFIIGVEMVSVGNRVKAGNIIAAIFALGQSFSGVVAYYLPYWRQFTMYVYTPSFIFFIYIWLYKESLRWLVSHGFKKEAVKVLLRAARVNKVKYSQKTMATLTLTNKDLGKAESKTNVEKQEELIQEPPVKKKSVCKKVLASKTMLFRICVCSYAWISVNIIYYGLSINSVSLAGSRYFNFIISSLIEIPGNLLSALTLDRFGRKWSMCIAYLSCGISLFSTGLIPEGLIATSLTMFGKLCISMISASTYIYTIELFPTEARHSLLAVCSMMGRIGAMLAPQTPLLMQSYKELPNVIFGILSAIAGLMMLLTPETLNMKLPDTIEQAEHLKMMPKTLKKTDVIGEEN